MSCLRNIVAPFVMAFLLLAIALPAFSHENQWEEIEYIGDEVKSISKQPDIEVFAAPQVIKVNLSKPLKIEIFTILGKLVSSQQLDIGSYEFRMNSHGVYIVKTEESTSKVAI